jgi:hypothetical protein
MYVVAEQQAAEKLQGSGQSLGELAATASPTTLALAGATLGISAFGMFRLFQRGSRAYKGNVGQEYDAWTEVSQCPPTKRFGTLVQTVLLYTCSCGNFISSMVADIRVMDPHQSVQETRLHYALYASAMSACHMDSQEGILEKFWGEHIHLGYYTEAERTAGYTKKDFKKAK